MKCRKCRSKTTLYFTKGNTDAFCFDCLKQNSDVKVRASYCPQCGRKKRARRLPLYRPTMSVCRSCSLEQGDPSRSFTGITLTLLFGVLFSLFIRYRYTRSIDSITSSSFWLLIITGACIWLLATFVAYERFNKAKNKGLIESAILGSGLGFGLWATEIYFTSNILTLLACLSGGAVAGILYMVAKSLFRHLIYFRS